MNPDPKLKQQATSSESLGFSPWDNMFTGNRGLQAPRIQAQNAISIRWDRGQMPVYIMFKTIPNGEDRPEQMDAKAWVQFSSLEELYKDAELIDLLLF